MCRDLTITKPGREAVELVAAAPKLYLILLGLSQSVRQNSRQGAGREGVEDRLVSDSQCGYIVGTHGWQVI